MKNFITLTESVFSQGKYFKAKEQYCFEDRLLLKTTCPLCAPCDKDKVLLHYRIKINDVNYYIPEYAAYISDCLINPINKSMIDRIKWERHQQPKDFRKYYKLLLGRDISNEYKADRNRRQEIMAVNFSNYGNADPKRGGLPLPRQEVGECPACKESDVIHPLTSVSLLPVYNICSNTALSLIPDIKGLEERLTFLWSTGETTRNLILSLTQSTNISLIVTDDIGCRYYAETTVMVYTLLVDIIYTVSGNYIKLQLDISGNDNPPYNITWSTGVTNQTSIIVHNIVGSRYSVIVSGQHCTKKIDIVI